MINDVGFVKLARRVLLELRHPGWRAGGVEDQSQLFVGALNPDVFDVTARQASALNEAIAWRARPADFHHQPAHAAHQAETAADHTGIADLEPVLVFFGNLDRSAGAICLPGRGSKNSQQPVSRDLSY